MIDHWWKFIGIKTSDDFEAWVATWEPSLMDAASGGELPPDFPEYLAEQVVRAREFHDLILYTAEIVNDNLGTLANEAASRANLRAVALIADRYGVAWPDTSVFAESRWADGDGWGRDDIPARLESWKNA